jgi:predicted  nucleic acid-binding Zn-ribbon protein
MAPDLKLAIQLQDVDARMKELQAEISALPKHIASIEKTLDSHLRKLEADRAALTANLRERKSLESEIQLHDQKVSKLKDQMMEARTNEQYRAFQKEIEYCQNGIRKAEDRILDLMAESEPLERNVQAAEASLKVEKQKVEAEKQTTRQRTAEDQSQLDQLSAERQQIVSGLNPKVYSAYERIRARRRWPAVAEAVDGRCSACHLALRPQFFQDLRNSEQVMFCESCGRILYHNPPVSFEDEAAPHESRHLQTGP